jgi:hypothetical protein
MFGARILIVSLCFAFDFTNTNLRTAPARVLSCGGVDVPITRNCYDALGELRRRGVRIVWVDAVCINQGSDEEKEGQIPLMRDIYGRARRVWVWLGKGTRLSDEAFEWIAQESAFDSILVAARLKGFPANMLPSEILRVMRLIPWVIGKSFPTNLTMTTVPN